MATLHGEKPRDYVHDSLGVVATLGLGRGIFEYRGLVITGLLAWLMHRGYHVLAIPTWERKLRVLVVWLTALVAGRDIVSLLSVQDPRGAFVSRRLRTCVEPSRYRSAPPAAERRAERGGRDRMCRTTRPSRRVSSSRSASSSASTSTSRTTST